VVETRGRLERRTTFLWLSTRRRARETRERVDDQALADMRAAVALAHEDGSQRHLAMMLLHLGYALLFHGDLDEAKAHLEAAFAFHDRAGDGFLRAHCLHCLKLAALRRHDLEAVRSLAAKSMAAAEAVGYPEYVAAAKAAMAWVAWREERSEDVLSLVGEALELWATNVVSYPFYFLGLWPLLAVRLAAGEVAEAVDAARQLLAPPQLRLPDELESAVQAGIVAWEEGSRRSAAERLSQAVELAQHLRFA
jgi:hypothetical protein